MRCFVLGLPPKKTRSRKGRTKALKPTVERESVHAPCALSGSPHTPATVLGAIPSVGHVGKALAVCAPHRPLHTDRGASHDLTWESPIARNCVPHAIVRINDDTGRSCVRGTRQPQATLRPLVAMPSTAPCKSSRARVRLIALSAD